MFYTIYKITNIINGKFYIGMHKTKDLNDGYMGSGKRLKNAIKCYGINNFVKDILYVFDNEKKMKVAEKILVVVDDQVSYNLCSGGHGGFSYINKNNLCDKVESGRLGGLAFKKRLSIDHELKSYMFDIFTQNVNSENAKKKRKESLPNGTFYGRNHTIETKEKISKFHRENSLGQSNSQYGTVWITNGTISRKIHSDTPIPENWYRGRVINKMEP